MNTKPGEDGTPLSMGDLEKAERVLEATQPLTEKVPKITVVVTTNLALGLLKLEQGKEDEARAHFEKSVDAFKNLEFTTEPLLHIETLLHLTSLYAKSGRLEKAAEMSAWARRLAETLKSDAGLAMALQAQAALHSANGDGKAAEQAYLESLKLWEKAGWPYYKAKALVTVLKPSRDEPGRIKETLTASYRNLHEARRQERFGEDKSKTFSVTVFGRATHTTSKSR